MEKFKQTATRWLPMIAAPMLLIYGIGFVVLPKYGFDWHPYVSIVQGFLAPIAAALKGGWFWGEKVQP
jgi:hypothetical protein